MDHLERSRERLRDFESRSAGASGRAGAAADANRAKNKPRHLLPIRGSGDAGASARKHDSGDNIRVPNQPPPIRRTPREELKMALKKYITR